MILNPLKTRLMPDECAHTSNAVNSSKRIKSFYDVLNEDNPIKILLFWFMDILEN